tara:strand:+ start:324 stop:899 length:576 start_codon:yes stop_codon:yes gene_type:complete
MNQQQVWDKIAPSWMHLRNKPIKELEILDWEKGKILDIGCGNCRNLLPFKSLECYGIDFSKEMLEQANKFNKKFNLNIKLKQAKITKLPFKGRSFDYVLAIAVLHHLKDPELAVKEINRVLKANGEAFITIWNKPFKKESFIPWKQKNKILNRYYNFIGYFKLRRLLLKNNLKILTSSFFGKNIIFLVKKI